MRAAELSQLARVLATARDAAEARLAALRREEGELRRQIGALEAARRRRAAEARATDVTLRAGVDLRWEGWVESRGAALSAELVRLLARIEVAREDVARAFGRHGAAEALLAEVRTAARAQARRAEDRPTSG